MAGAGAGMSRREPTVIDRPDLRPTDVTRAEVEDLIYHEAYLLDEWRMEEWLELWVDDAEYVVPTNDNPHGDPTTTSCTSTTTTACSRGSSCG